MLINKAQFHQLVANYDEYVDDNNYRFLDVLPVVRIYDQKGLVWFLVHMNPEGSFAYGFEDSGNGDPRTGWFELKEMADRDGINACERDDSFVANGPMRTYLMAAQDRISVADGEEPIFFKQGVQAIRVA